MVDKLKSTLASKHNNEKSTGQYFTPHFVAEFMINLISKPDTGSILEPSAGTGIFLDIIDKMGKFTITGIELDISLINQSVIPIIYQDFLDYPTHHKFDIAISRSAIVQTTIGRAIVSHPTLQVLLDVVSSPSRCLAD